MFDHFGRRLQRDLKGIVDQRIATSEVASGSLMRVRYFSSSPPPSFPLRDRLLVISPISFLPASPPSNRYLRLLSLFALRSLPVSTSTSSRTRSSGTPSGSVDPSSPRRPSSTRTATTGLRTRSTVHRSFAVSPSSALRRTKPFLLFRRVGREGRRRRKG